MLILTAVFNILDYYFTIVVTALGGRELNPLAAPFVNSWVFSVFKLIIVPLLLGLVWKLRYKVNVLRLQVYTFVVFACYLALMLYYGAIFGFLL